MSWSTGALAGGPDIRSGLPANRENNRGNSSIWFPQAFKTQIPWAFCDFSSSFVTGNEQEGSGNYQGAKHVRLFRSRRPRPVLKITRLQISRLPNLVPLPPP